MMCDEKCTIFDLDIRELTREWICAEATVKGCEPEEALDMIVKEWKNYRVSGVYPEASIDFNTSFFSDGQCLSDDIAEKVIQRLKDEFILTTE